VLPKPLLAEDLVTQIEHVRLVAVLSPTHAPRCCHRPLTKAPDDQLARRECGEPTRCEGQGDGMPRPRRSPPGAVPCPHRTDSPSAHMLRE
jgi:hypothetical protein